MASATNFFNRSYHKIPRKVEVDLKITGAADVNADGYTINVGSDLVGTVAKNGEGVIDITTNFGWSQLTSISVFNKVKTFKLNYTSDTAASSLVKITSVNDAGGTAHGNAADPDADVIFVRMTFNTSSVVDAK